MPPEIILIIILIAILYVIYNIIYYIKSNKEYFSGSVPYDICAYLAAWEEYLIFYNNTGKTECKQLGVTEPLCSAYGGIVGPTYTFSPPVLTASQIKEKQLQYKYLSGVQVGELGAILERPVFTYYCRRPTSFDYAATYNTKTGIERYIDENCKLLGSYTSISGYITYITIAGKNYTIRKAFMDGTINEVLGCANTTDAGRQFAVFAGVGMEAPAQYGRWTGGVGKESDLFTILLGASSQEDLNTRLKPASASGSASASATVSDTQKDTPSSLQLSPLTYLPDARMQNKKLFDAMYKGIQNPSAALTKYYKSTNVTAPTDSYVATVAKFIQLDKWILAGATIGTTVDTSKLVDKAGSAYTFRVPYPYNPADTSVVAADNKEASADPLESAIDLKNYNLAGFEADILTYFKTIRRYESVKMTNAQIADKLREGICASSGYYTNTNLSKCKCTNGCCIPVAYKAKSSCLAPGAVIVPPSTGLSSESQAILGKVDNCVHMHSQFKLVRAGPTIRIGPSPTCIDTPEGFIDLPRNYGGARGGIEMKGRIQELKGWAVSPLGRAM